MSGFSRIDREDAAIICSITASNPNGKGYYLDAAQAIGASVRATALATEALLLALRGRSPYVPGPGAEAEALIRTGWTP